jgi:hypothetical protein
MAGVESTWSADTSYDAITPERPVLPSRSASVRYLTVSAGSPGPRVHPKSVIGIVPAVPSLRIQGQWLKQAGFEIGMRVKVQVRSRGLVIKAEDDCEDSRSGLRLQEPPQGRFAESAPFDIYSQLGE